MKNYGLNFLKFTELKLFKELTTQQSLMFLRDKSYQAKYLRSLKNQFPKIEFFWDLEDVDSPAIENSLIEGLEGVLKIIRIYRFTTKRI